MNKLISVIVPVYNTAPYLERCVNSILAQTYAHIEIILINARKIIKITKAIGAIYCNEIIYDCI